ncbi:hypothetical protein RCL1_002969 [Eukaryota sp. TZLM3-RCL]
MQSSQWVAFLESKKRQLENSASLRIDTATSSTSMTQSHNLTEPLSPPSPPSPLKVSLPSKRSPKTPTLCKKTVIQAIVNNVSSVQSPYRSPSPPFRVQPRSLPAKHDTVQEALNLAQKMNINLEEIKPRKKVYYSPAHPLPDFFHTPTKTPKSAFTMPYVSLETPEPPRSVSATPGTVPGSRIASKRISQAKSAQRENDRKLFWKVVKEAQELNSYDKQLVDEFNTLCKTYQIPKQCALVDQELGDLLEETFVNEFDLSGNLLRSLTMNAFRREFKMLQSQTTSFRHSKKANVGNRSDLFRSSSQYRLEIHDIKTQVVSDTKKLVATLKEQLSIFQDYGGFY